MKKILLILAFLLGVTNIGYSQHDKVWSEVRNNDDVKKNKYVQRENFPESYELMRLDMVNLKELLTGVSDRFSNNARGVVITLPNSEGVLERFKIFEASNFEASLQEQYPEIRSYVGNGIDDKTARLRMSVDSRGVNTMVSRADKGSEFMEPYSQDGAVHVIYNSLNVKGKRAFTCSTVDKIVEDDLINKSAEVSRSSTGQLLNFRLAMSVTPEYTAYHGGTKALALAAINTTLTRVNGVFETDFAIHLNLVNNMTIIYDGTVQDPYGPTDANYNTELQNTLTTVVGNANYDVGHLMGNVGNNGNAGCIGCVCGTVGLGQSDVGDGKGSGFTTSVTPVGDNFDIDFVAHEIGHQFGANHTFSHGNEGSGVNVEVGSGVTIMGYAGITPYDTHGHSVDVFHSASIAQVQANMTTKTCQTITAINHSAPVVDAGLNYTIPKGTPFMLTGSATDAGGSEALTYTWEQYNNASGTQTNASSAASPTKSSGPNWVNYVDSSIPSRRFPFLRSTLNNNTTTNGIDVMAEALSSVARTLTFRLTARDNVAGQGQTGFDDMIVTVDASKGPLDVTSQSTTGISWEQGSVETITWAVNNTNALSGSTNVDILLSTDGGLTYSTVLLANTPNDGSQTIVVPNIMAPYCRVMVKSSGNIFYDINTKDFAIGYTVTDVCNSYTMNTSFAVPDANGNFTVRAINVPTSELVTDVNLAVSLTHTYISDINIALLDPAGLNQIDIFSGQCTSNNNINATFDDQGSPIICSPTIIGNVVPSQALSIYNGTNPNGNWLIGVRDLGSGDVGMVNSYTLTICSQQAVLSTESFGIDDFVLYPNPNNGNFNIKFSSNNRGEISINVHDIRGRRVFDRMYQNTGVFNESLQLNNVHSGVYLVTVQDGDRKEVKKIVIQ